MEENPKSRQNELETKVPASTLRIRLPRLALVAGLKLTFRMAAHHSRCAGGPGNGYLVSGMTGPGLEDLSDSEDDSNFMVRSSAWSWHDLAARATVHIQRETWELRGAVSLH